MAHETMTMTRTFHAPRAAVWAAWTEAEQLKAWWGPHHFSNAEVSVDLRVGGIQRIDMRGPDGASYPLASTYREIRAPERLVLLNRVMEDVTGNALFEVLTTVTFAEDRGRTTLTVVEEVMSAHEGAARHLAGMEAGMDQSLERLGAHLGSLVLAVPDDEPILWMARIFDAPRDLVWQALTDPKHAVHWWGQRAAKNVVFEMDSRPGGKWRVHQQYPDGQVFKFKGEVREVEAPHRIVQTFGMEDMFEDKVIVETVTLTDIGNGRTLYKVVSRFENFDDRAGMIMSGMSYGAQEMLNRLDEYVRTL
ncbi:MAG: SRPBCC domain-containing protein [Bauldia sp.]|nr:SRPBCC domain-containing protein [Bauldia sp.]